MATLVHDTLCATLSGLSKVYRACGYRVGWAVFSGRTHARRRVPARARAALLAAPVQQRAGAVGGADRARRLPEHPRARRPGRPAVRVARARSSTPSRTAASCRLAPPRGAMYAFVGVDPQVLPDFDDQQFALDLLEQKHVLVAPGRELQRARTAITSASPTCRTPPRSGRCSRASRSCSASYAFGGARAGGGGRESHQRTLQVISPRQDPRQPKLFRLATDLTTHLRHGGTLVVPTRQRLRAVQLAYAAAAARRRPQRLGQPGCAHARRLHAPGSRAPRRPGPERLAARTQRRGRMAVVGGECRPGRERPGVPRSRCARARPCSAPASSPPPTG